MAASITANPKSLTVPTWGIPLKTTVSWNTGSPTLKGAVYLTVVDASTNAVEISDELFDDGAGKLVPPKPIGSNPAGAVSGSWPQAVAAGKTYLFRLKRVDNSAVLQSTTVDGLEKLGLPAPLVNGLLKRIPFNQGITSLKVVPGVDTVRVRFKTRQPVAPLVEIFDVQSGALVGLRLPVPSLVSQSHDIHFELGNGLWKVLDQETDFRFHIVAASMPNWGTNKTAEASGLFRSGYRRAQVFFDSIDVHDDGDPGFYLGAGDFDIFFGAGDVATGETLATTPLFGRAEISSGESADLDRSLAIDHAPASLWVQVKAFENDVGFTFGEEEPIEFAPEGSDWSVSSEVEMSTVTRFLDLSEAGQPPQTVPFTLETGEKHVNFTVNGRLQMEAQQGVNLQAGMATPAAPRRPFRNSAVLSELGERVVLGDRKHARRIQLAPQGLVYGLAEGGKSTAGDRFWKRLTDEADGPLSACLSGDTLHLLKVAPDGHVDHKTFLKNDSRGGAVDANWQSLGGRVVAPVLATVLPKRIDLFALDRAGRVVHRQLTGSRKDDWRVVGQGITDSLNAFTSPRHDLVLLGRGPRGKVHFQHWAAGQSLDEKRAWKSLGAAPEGELSAEFIDDSVAIASLSEDETVHLAIWADFPDAPATLEWRAVGTVTSLLDSRLSLLNGIRG